MFWVSCWHTRTYNMKKCHLPVVAADSWRVTAADLARPKDDVQIRVPIWTGSSMGDDALDAA